MELRVLEKGLRFTQEFQVTPMLHEAFIAAFHDRNPLHVDGQYARQHGFSAPVMHGNILGGFISYFVGECLPVKNVILMTQEIRYRRPFYSGDSLLFSASIEVVSEAVSVYGFKFTFARAGETIASGSFEVGLLK